MPTTHKVISLAGSPPVQEFQANSAITPGHLVELMTTGRVRPHATAGGVKPLRWFADYEEYSGGTINTPYAINEQVKVLACAPGDRIWALVPANAAAIVAGDLLESAGDGTLRKATNFLTDNSGGTANATVQAIGGAYSQSEVANNIADLVAAINRTFPGAVARALEALDNSAVGTPSRIRIEVI